MGAAGGGGPGFAPTLRCGETLWDEVGTTLGRTLPARSDGLARRSGRLQDIQTGDLVRVKKGGLKERVHVNHLKLFCPRNVDKVAVMESSLVELAAWETECEIGRRVFTLGDD